MRRLNQSRAVINTLSDYRASVIAKPSNKDCMSPQEFSAAVTHLKHEVPAKIEDLIRDLEAIKPASLAYW